MLSTEIKNSLDASVLCWLATITKDGLPNVTPKEVFTPFGSDHLLIANIASPGSVRNVKFNPNVCVSFVEVFDQRGFKLLGKAEIVGKNHSDYNEVHAPLYALAGDSYPIISIFKIKVEKVEEINAPSYHLYPDIPETERRSSAMTNYGVKPL
ncbi:MAG: pyridoxamine 5'-phosphate oxidase family protein [Acidimicrobiales bacterium]|nr:pyridoxamine 5'-phosphate oxidase family protein [Hyphomonadaceae bacterium]RZV42394.1 MAG: pyridoxamine 5'-phosphate oxidase family protein [Acidimicrobiales bacterium]